METKWEWKKERLRLRGSYTFRKWGEKIPPEEELLPILHGVAPAAGGQHPPERPFWNQHLVSAR